MCFLLIKKRIYAENTIKGWRLVMKHLFLILLIGYLGLYNGQLALYGQNRAIPETLLPYRVEMFPEADQKALKNGIPYESETELNRLMEDFLS